jgi:hypothetical protein
MMKNLLLILVVTLLADLAIAQEKNASTPPKKDWSKVSLANRSKDHFVFQLGYHSWTNTPDSIRVSGLPRTFNVYFMMDFPFKTDPRLSVAIGAGAGFDNQYFSKTEIDISGKRYQSLTFKNMSDSNHFKKYKLNNSYLEAPVELRFSSSPETPNKSFKAALGVKLGTMISATVKGKNWQSPTGQLINGYTQKEKSRRFFNGTRISLTARAGYGVISVFASYQVNSFVKDGFGPDIRPMTVGLMVSGL